MVSLPEPPTATADAAADTSQIRVGLIGAGENTRVAHIPGLKAIPGVTLVGVANRTPDSSRRVALDHGIDHIYADWAEMVSDPEIDAIVIGTWPNMHCRITVTALEAGKHVLCEARMARSAAEAHEMLRASRSRPNQVAQLVPAPDTLGFDKTINRLVADGYLGELLAVIIREGGSFVASDTPLHWRQDADISGFNVLSLGIWYESVMRWIGEAVRVAAMTRVFVKMRNDADGKARAVRVPDHVDVLAEMACGAQAHFQISAVTGFAEESEVLLHGSEGTLRVYGDRLFGGQRSDSGLAEIEIPQEELGSWRVEEEFINAIRGLEQVRLTTFQAGVKYMEFTEAVARSASSGRAIALPLMD